MAMNESFVYTVIRLVEDITSVFCRVLALCTVEAYDILYSIL